MRILFILEYYYPHIGGVEKLFKILCEELVINGHEVTVLTNRYKSDLQKRETINGVTVRRLNFYNRYLFTFLSLPYALNYAGKCEIVHTTSFNAALPAYFAARLRRKKIYITFHEAWGKLWFKLPFINWFSRRMFYLYEKFILSFSFTKFIAVSDYTRDCLIELGVSNARVIRIYNGIEYRNSGVTERQGPGKFVFTYFGRLGPSKGLDLLLPAAREFLARNPEAVLRLIIPTERNKIFNYVRREVKNGGFEHQVEFKHNLTREELSRAIESSSCIVIPSYSEGFCFAAAETIELGVPLISSNQGALKEVVSGKFIKMEKQDAGSLIKSLERAKVENWEETQVKRFEIKNFVLAYKKLFSNQLD